MELEELSKVIEDALSAISKRDYEAINPNSRNINGENKFTNYSKAQTHPEINFVSSLKGEIKQLVKSLGFDEETSPEFFPQSDFPKRIFNLPQNFLLFEKYKIKDIISPDLFFHLSQDDNNPENQRIILECKIDKNLNENKFKKDLAKLIIFIEQLNYQKGILLIVNNDLERIKNFYNDFVNEHTSFEHSLVKIEIWIKNYGDDLIILNY